MIAPKHTELPWRWDYGRSEVLGDKGILGPDGGAVFVNCGRGSGNPSKPDIALILAAVNSHAAAVALTEAVLTVGDPITPPNLTQWDQIAARARAFLEASKGEK